MEKQDEVGGLAAGAVDGSDLNGEIVDDSLGTRSGAGFLFDWSSYGHLSVRPSIAMLAWFPNPFIL